MDILHTVVVVNKKLEILHQQASFNAEDIEFGLQYFDFDIYKLLEYGVNHYYDDNYTIVKAIYTKIVV